MPTNHNHRKENFKGHMGHSVLRRGPMVSDGDMGHLVYLFINDKGATVLIVVPLVPFHILEELTEVSYPPHHKTGDKSRKDHGPTDVPNPMVDRHDI